MAIIIHCNSNQYKCEDYITDLNDGNFGYNLNAAIVGTYIEENYIHSGWVYSDIDNQQQNSTLPLLFAVANIKSTVCSRDQLTSTIIFYCSSG